MNEPHIKQHVMVDDYLAGSLSERDLAMFEERLLWDKTLMEEVALAEGLRNGLREYGFAPASDVRELGREEQATWWSSPAYRIAASLLLAVSLSFNFIQAVDTTSDTTETLVGDPTPQVIWLVAERSAEAREIAIDPEGRAVLTIDSVDGFEEFRLTLTALDDSSPPVAVETGLRAMPPDPLAISVPASALPPGDYLLSLDARRSEAAEFELVSEVSFRATARP